MKKTRRIEITAVRRQTSITQVVDASGRKRALSGELQRHEVRTMIDGVLNSTQTDSMHKQVQRVGPTDLPNLRKRWWHRVLQRFRRSQ